MRKILFMATLALLATACQTNQDNDKAPITKPEITIEGGRLTPEALWAMGRINSVHPDEQSGRIAYTVSYYSVEENRSTSWIRVCEAKGEEAKGERLELIDEFVGHSPAWHNGELCYINKDRQVVIGKKILTGFNMDIEGFLLSPQGDKIILIAQVKTVTSTEDKYPDLPLASGRVVDDLMYKHWDEWTETAPHPFLCDLSTLNSKLSTISVIGVENWGKPPFPRYGDLSKATKGFEPAQFNILLSHDPNHWKSEVSSDNKYKYIDLTLSGHTHSAQIGIELGESKWSPSQWIFDHWDGLYQKGTQYLFVSRGLGYVGIPFRLGMPAEISVITMRCDR